MNGGKPRNVLRHAIRVAPGHARAHEDLGTVLLNQGQHAQALPLLQKAAELMPNNPSVFTKLGGALSALGRSEDAQKVLAKASALLPAQAKLEQATQLFAEGKFRESERLAQDLLSQNPRDVNAALLLARIANHAKCYDDAEILLLKIVELAPKFSSAWFLLGAVLRELDRSEEAVVALRKAVDFDGENALAHYFLGASLAMAAKTDEAVGSYRTALRLDPNLTGAHVGLGHVLKTLGDQEGGIAAYRRAIQLQPDFGETYYSLSNLKTFRFTETEIENMRQIITKPNLPTDCWVHLSFAIGKAYEDIGDYQQAFEFYLKANQKHRESIAYDPVQTQIAHERMRSTFTEAFFVDNFKRQGGSFRSDPIFIVGLPRSGSTLLEQILASHSLVDGTSELPDISMLAVSTTDRKSGSVFPSSILERSAADLTALGEQYLKQTMRHRGRTPFFTDKMPNNFAYVGFIKAILPNAKIIDARRHPMDSCIGCFKQHFAKGQTFTYDLFELGEFYLEYEQLMTHWDDVLPGQVLHVQYESVVADLETQVRRILDFCGLEFEDNCVNFHETKRAVRTASSEQVRQPIYQGSVATWKRFGPHLDELRQVLSPVLPAEDQWVPGS